MMSRFDEALKVLRWETGTVEAINIELKRIFKKNDVKDLQSIDISRCSEKSFDRAMMLYKNLKMNEVRR